MPLIKKEGWLNRNVLATGFTSLLSDASHEMITALLPIFVTLSTALGGLGASAAILGLIEGASDGLSSLSKPISGHLSDRTKKRKPWMVLGYIATGILLPAMAFVQSTFQLAMIRISAWMGRGVRGPPRDALLSDSVGPEHYGKAFGLHRAMDSMGAIIGPTMAFLLLSYLGVRETMLFALIPGILSVMVVVLFIKEVKRPKNTMRKVDFRSSLRELPKRFRYLVLAQGVFGVGNFTNVLFTLAALTILTPSMGPIAAASTSVMLYTLLNVVYAVTSYPVGVLADRYNKSILLGLGYFFNAFACLLMTLWTGNMLILGLAFLAVGLQLALTDTTEAALAAELLPKDIVGTGYGVLQLVDGVGDFLSSFIVGIIWVAVSPQIGLLYSAVLSIMAVLVILFLMSEFEGLRLKGKDIC